MTLFRDPLLRSFRRSPSAPSPDFQSTQTQARRLSTSTSSLPHTLCFPCPSSHHAPPCTASPCPGDQLNRLHGAPRIPPERLATSLGRRAAEKIRNSASLVIEYHPNSAVPGSCTAQQAKGGLSPPPLSAFALRSGAMGAAPSTDAAAPTPCTDRHPWARIGASRSCCRHPPHRCRGCSRRCPRSARQCPAPTSPSS